MKAPAVESGINKDFAYWKIYRLDCYRSWQKVHRCREGDVHLVN